MIFEEISKFLLIKRMFCDILKSHANETLVCISFQERGDFMEFGEKLKQIRIASHMSQEQLADITGLEQKTIARYEMGETIPRYNKVYEKLGEFNFLCLIIQYIAIGSSFLLDNILAEIKRLS